MLAPSAALQVTCSCLGEVDGEGGPDKSIAAGGVLDEEGRGEPIVLGEVVEGGCGRRWQERWRRACLQQQEVNLPCAGCCRHRGPSSAGGLKGRGGKASGVR